MRKAILTLNGILLAAFLVLSAATWMDGYKAGDKAVDFKLKNVDEKMVSMADNASAKGYILVFTCNTCPFSQAYEDRIIALHKKYAPQGYPVIAINPNDPAASAGDSFAKMQQRAKEKKFPFPYLIDETQSVAKTYGATRTPHVFIVKKEAADFVVQYIGTIDDNSQNPEDVQKKYVEEAMAEIMAGKPVSQTLTKAIGCTIKWKTS